MAPTTSTSRLESLASRYQRRLDIVQRIQSLVDEDPTLLNELRLTLAGPSPFTGLPTNTSEGNGNGRTQFETIRDFFRSRENRWTDAPTIMARTGLNRGAVSHVLYKGRAEAFEKMNHPKDGKMKLWRLKGGESA